MPMVGRSRSRCAWGIDEDHLTYRDAARIAADEGLPGSPCARTAAQMYSGQAHWSAITDLVTDLHPLPVLGNGDIWTAKTPGR